MYTDGHTFCFACGAHVRGDAVTDAEDPRPPRGLTDFIGGELRGLRARKITDDTCKHFNYRVGLHHNRTVQIAPYYDADGRLVAQHLRTAGKEFPWIGEPKHALPFGAHCWPKTGKMIVVTEGEIDALSMSQVQGNKWPVVSIGCGAGPQIKKYFARHRAYFSGFEKVILMFDMDEPGRLAVKEAATVLGASAHIAHLQLKDANEMLVAGRTAELITAMWQAKQYRPEGILDMADLKEEVMRRPQWGLSWPFEQLTKLTYGRRTGEIYTLGAGTGIGKTDFMTQTMKHLIVEHKVPIGVFALEQKPSETATRLGGKLVAKTLHIPDSGCTDEDYNNAWTVLQASGKVFLYDSFGQNDWQVVCEKIEYLHHAYGVRFFFLDHLTALAAWEDDERKGLETIMSEMGALVKKLDIALIQVSHLATPDGRPHEEGGRVMIRHFKGSRAIGFWSHFMFGLERDQQAAEKAVRETTVFRLLKDRYTGRSTGAVFHFRYDQETGMLYEAQDPTKAESHGFAREGEDDPSEGGEF
jgi:twinkle protein